MSTNQTTGVFPANKQVAAIDDEWRTLESVTETKTETKPVPAKEPPRRVSKPLPPLPRAALPVRAPLPPPPPRPSRKPAPPPVFAAPRIVPPPPLPAPILTIVPTLAPIIVTTPVTTIEQPVAEAMICASVIVEEAAVAEPLAIVPLSSRRDGRDVVREVFAAGGRDCEDGFDELPIPPLQSNTTLYAMWSALGVTVATGLGSAIWMAFIQKPG